MYKILIIEDDSSYRELLNNGLTELGYEITTVSSAKLALKIMDENKFKLIICDVLMPEMDGHEFLINFKELNVSSKIIMISGGGVSNTKLYLDNTTILGSDAVLDKPFTIEN